MDIQKYWKAVLTQSAEEMKSFIHEDAQIRWHNTNEQFTKAEFIRVNCEYPGQWDGKIERLLYADSLIITVVHVYSKNQKQSFHVTSFINTAEDRILSIDEYWGDDGSAPQWRIAQHIGTPIRDH